MNSENGAIILNPFPKAERLQIEAPAAISAHSHSTEWQQTATVMQRRADRDGWIDRRLHMRTCLLINSCWQRANTLGSLVEMSVMLAISFACISGRMCSTCDRGVLRLAYKVRNMPKHFFITCQNWFHLVSVQASLRLYVTRNKKALIFRQWWTNNIYEQLKWVGCVQNWATTSTLINFDSESIRNRSSQG